jgi:hypothetical protein
LIGGKWFDIFCDSVVDKKLKWRRSLAATGRFDCSEKLLKAEIPYQAIKRI